MLSGGQRQRSAIAQKPCQGKSPPIDFRWRLSSLDAESETHHPDQSPQFSKTGQRLPSPSTAQCWLHPDQGIFAERNHDEPMARRGHYSTFQPATNHNHRLKQEAPVLNLIIQDQPVRTVTITVVKAIWRVLDFCSTRNKIPSST